MTHRWIAGAIGVAFALSTFPGTAHSQDADETNPPGAARRMPAATSEIIAEETLQPAGRAAQTVPAATSERVQATSQIAEPQGLQAGDLANVLPPRLIITGVEGALVASQPMLINYELTNPGLVPVSGVVSGSFNQVPLTNPDGNALAPVTLSPGASITGSLRLVSTETATHPLQLSFIKEGECRERPTPSGRTRRVCENTVLAHAAQDLTLIAPPSPPPSLFDIAAHWAPVLSHDVDNSWGDRVWGDYITSVDFDGDWKSSNNWDNLLKHPLPAHVYYWAAETDNNWFLGYLFFHPRDWSNANDNKYDGDITHNNDFESILVVVRRSPNHRFGQFLAMVTVAHWDFYSYTDSDTPPDSPWFEALRLSRNVNESSGEDIDGDVDFVADDHGLHPVVYVEAEGHGVYGSPRRPDKPTDWAQFGRYSVTDWNGGSWDGIVLPPKSGRPTEPEDRGGWGDGVIFHYEGTADVPTSRPGGAPTGFEVVGYSLIEITALLEKRLCPETFNSSGSFDGGADPPWKQNDRGAGLAAGQIFDSPANLFSHYFDGPDVGTEYPPYTRRSYDPSAGASCPQ
jgi:hypothetical protein